MNIEIREGGAERTYTYFISRPGCPGLAGDDYTTLAELFHDLAQDGDAKARIAAMVRDENK